MQTGKVPGHLARMSALAAAFALAACSALTAADRAAVERVLAEEYGLTSSMLLTNGLSQNGISTAEFGSWFNQDAQLGDTVMQLLVRCAVPPGQSRSWTNPATGAAYRWTGQLDLAPDWAGGSPATPREQKALIACLAAHVKKLGIACRAPAGGGPRIRGACLAQPPPGGPGLRAAGAGGEAALHAARPGG